MTIAAGIFIEFGGPNAVKNALHYEMLANGKVQGLQALPRGYTILTATKSRTNPASVDLIVVNGGGPITPESVEAIQSHIRENWKECRAGKFSDLSLSDR